MNCLFGVSIVLVCGSTVPSQHEPVASHESWEYETQSVCVSQAVHECWGVSDQAVPHPQHVLFIYLCGHLTVM